MRNSSRPTRSRKGGTSIVVPSIRFSPSTIPVERPGHARRQPSVGDDQYLIGPQGLSFGDLRQLLQKEWGQFLPANTGVGSLPLCLAEGTFELPFGHGDVGHDRLGQNHAGSAELPVGGKKC